MSLGKMFCGILSISAWEGYRGMSRLKIIMISKLRNLSWLHISSYLFWCSPSTPPPLARSILGLRAWRLEYIVYILVTKRTQKL